MDAKVFNYIFSAFSATYQKKNNKIVTLFHLRKTRKCAAIFFFDFDSCHIMIVLLCLVVQTKEPITSHISRTHVHTYSIHLHNLLTHTTITRKIKRKKQGGNPLH